LITKDGSNFMHGSAYEYFRNEAFNANDPNLKAAQLRRPEMRRNVYGGALGGPLLKNRIFVFGSYQGTREANGATDQSLYKSVFVSDCLTDDRSIDTLVSGCKVPFVDPISLQLLNTHLPGGQFLIPTPQTASGRVTGTALSTFHEEQFNLNLDYQAGSKDSLAGKFFFAHAPLFSALAGSNFGTPASLPGFGTYVNITNRVLSIREIHTFTPSSVNELRFGYNFIRHDEVPQESLQDQTIGIERATASEYPGLPLISLARDEGGATIGTSDITYRGTTPSFSLSDVLSLQRGKQNLRLGGEARYSRWRAHAAVFSYGEIDFPTFSDFLTGNSDFAHLSSGLTQRDFRTTDYHLFLQDDWKLTPRFTVNLGLRYELDLAPYDAQGRIGGFDPALYRPNMEVDSDGFPVGPPAGGIIEAGNAPSPTIPGVTRVGKRIIKNIDANNFAPRIGIAWSPLKSGRLSARAGYGIFYSRPSFAYLALEYFAPPFFLASASSGQPFANPFGAIPPDSSFPLIQPGTSLTSEVVDRNARTPYTHQFNSSLQYGLARDTTVQVAYAGSRGVRLYRGVTINQARIASLNHPIVNAVTGQTITANSFDNASLRAPMQGVDPFFFTLNSTTAHSTYDSFQGSINRQSSHGLQFSASYTFSKSIDNASSPGGGARSDGSLDLGGGLDTASTWGNQLDPRANRGLSDFDRTHRLVVSSVWETPEPSFARDSAVARLMLSHWQVSAIVIAMSGLPVDIFDPSGGSLYGAFGDRPNWGPGATRRSAMTNVPAGYSFNPLAFAQAIVRAGAPIPSASDPTALSSDLETDIGNLGRNVLRGPAQSDFDISLGKRFPLSESTGIEIRAEFFNVLNHANRDNPVSDISAADFGRVVSYSSSPRIVQFMLKLTF
jgi:hypothetical protein